MQVIKWQTLNGLRNIGNSLIEEGMKPRDITTYLRYTTKGRVTEIGEMRVRPVSSLIAVHKDAELNARPRDNEYTTYKHPLRDELTS